MVQNHQLHLLLLVLIPIQHCGGGLIDLEDIIYQFLLRNCSIDERLVTYYVVGDSQIRGFDPVKDFVNYPPVTMEVGPVIYGEAQVHLLQLSAVYVQIFHNNQTGVVGKAHISEEVLHEDEYMWTVNKGLDFTSKVKFTVNVPLVYQFSSEISTSVKTGSGSTTVETRTTKQLIKQDVIIPPGATLEAKWYVNEAQVVVPWESNITLSGYIMALIEKPKQELNWRHFLVGEIKHDNITTNGSSAFLRASGLFTANVAKSYHLSTTEKQLTHRTASLAKYILQQDS